MAIDHSACDHPRTPAGRRACRAGRTPSERVGDALTLTKAERKAAGMVKPRTLKLPPVVPATDPRNRLGFDPDSIELPGDRKTDKQRRAELPFADRCGHVHCPHPKADHVAGMSCLNMGGGTWKSNVKKDAAAFARMYPNR